MGNVNNKVVAFYKQLGFTLIDIKSSVFRVEESTLVFQTDHKDHTVDASTILYKDAEKIFALTDQRTALLTELRQVITKKLTTRTYKIITQYEPNSIASITIPANQESAYNLGATITLKDLQAHLDELINPTNV